MRSIGGPKLRIREGELLSCEGGFLRFGYNGLASSSEHLAVGGEDFLPNRDFLLALRLVTDGGLDCYGGCFFVHLGGG